MKKLLLSLLLTVISLNAYTQTSGRVILKLKEGVNAAFKLNEKKTGINELDLINKANGITGLEKLNSGKKSGSVLFVAAFPAGADTEAIIQSYTETGTVEYAEPDFTGSGAGVMAAPNDSHYTRQWGLHNDGSFSLFPAVAGADIAMENAWDIEQGSSDITLAVMDSGLRMGHPEFAGRLWVNTGEIPGNGIDDDSNGYIDDINGWDFVNSDNLPADDHGHGTNVTGIAAANGNNAIGYSGVDRNCKVMVLKGLDSGNFGSYSWWYNAIVYAADNGADVINLSVGGSSFSTTLQDAVNYALDNGVVVVACMMNTNTSVSYYPARFTGVIAVGSTDPDDTRTAPFFWAANSGSNYGTHISVIAPGNFIYGLSHLSDTNYDTYWGGTSQATPLVAGLASLLLAQDPSRTPAQIKALIEETADDLVGDISEDIPGFDIFYGHGRINATNALSAVLSSGEYELPGNEVVLYPNPAKGSFTVQANTYPAQVTLYNSLGQKVLQKQIDGSNNSVAVATAGIYMAVIENGNKKTSKKIVIQ